MKYLEYTPLGSINYFLSHLNLGECTLKGKLEAYSCKHTGSDKRMSFSLEHEILDYLGRSSDSDSLSPTDFLSCRSSRKTLVYLVLTLCHMYPDHDFSAVHAHRYFREEEWDSFVQIFNTYMLEAEKEWALTAESCTLFERVAQAIDEVIKLVDCDIYSYCPDSEGDPLLVEGAIWSFNVFFYNRKLKRVLSFRCCCMSNLAAEGFLELGSHNEDDHGDIFYDMDM